MSVNGITNNSNSYQMAFQWLPLPAPAMRVPPGTHTWLTVAQLCQMHTNSPCASRAALFALALFFTETAS